MQVAGGGRSAGYRAYAKRKAEGAGGDEPANAVRSPRAAGAELEKPVRGAEHRASPPSAAAVASTAAACFLGAGAGVPTVSSAEELARLLGDLAASDPLELRVRLMSGPVLVARLADDGAAWEGYARLDEAPVGLNFLEVFDRGVYIIELSESLIHSFYAMETFGQLARQSAYLSGGGSGSLGSKQADQIIFAKTTTPGFRALPPRLLNPITGGSRDRYASVIVEVGVSQNYKNLGGLDAKANGWLQTNRDKGLEYILCIKIEKDANWLTTGCSYKLYDVPSLGAHATVFPLNVQPIVDFSNGQHAVVLDSRRVHNITPGSPLPQGVGATLRIDLSAIRDEALASQY